MRDPDPRDVRDSIESFEASIANLREHRARLIEKLNDTDALLADFREELRQLRLTDFYDELVKEHFNKIEESKPQ